MSEDVLVIHHTIGVKIRLNNVVVDKNSAMLKANDCKVYFKKSEHYKDKR